MNIGGVDPGVTGGLAMVGKSTETICMPMATTCNGKDIVDGLAVANWFLHRHADVVVVEAAGARPGQGVVSMFRFGFVTGQVVGALQAAGIGIYRVPPRVWKKHMGLLKQDKKQSLVRAREEFPENVDEFKRKTVDHGRAEAALMAVWYLDMKEGVQRA